MKIKHILILILSVLLLAAVVAVAVYLIGSVRDEIDITDTASQIFSAFEEKALSGKANALTAKEQKMSDHWSEVSDICFGTMDHIVTRYASTEIDAQTASAALDCFALFPVTGGQINAYKEEISAIEQGRTSYEQALAEDDPVKAALLFSQVSKRDTSIYEDASRQLRDRLSTSELEKLINEYKSKYQISEALSLLERISGMWTEKTEIDTLIKNVEDYQSWQEETVPYRRTVEVLSVRNLMAFPEMVYAPSSAYAESYDSALITPDEFRGILESLYEKNYILIDIALLESDGKLAEIKIPSGKTPVVITMEDLTYPIANAGSGVVGKIALDEKGALCTVTGGKTSYDNESVLILEEFAKTHPDFVFQGARGCISLTGYDGIFGYRLEREDEAEDAAAVAAYLREQGWTFACHSYSYANMSTASVETLKTDTEKWLSQIGNIVGETCVYVWPYGASVRSGEAHEYLYSKGFHIFCGTGVAPYRAAEADGCGIFVDRKPLSGYSLRNRREDYLHLFDADQILDSQRPAKDDKTDNG